MADLISKAEKLGAQVIQRAGQRLLKYFGRTTAHEKGVRDVVTEADTDIEQLILGELEKNFPDWQAISEERTPKGVGTLKEFCWVLDPVDGTVNFAYGVPFFCISLALLHRSRPVLGWVYDPTHHEMFHARAGRGAFLNRSRLRLPARLPSVIVGVDALFWEWLGQRSDAHFLETLARLGRARTYGCQALALCYVAAGRLRASITSGCKIWDDAAGALIIEEAGGCYRNWRGRRIFPVPSNSPILAGGPIESVAADCANIHMLTKSLKTLTFN